MRIYAVIPTHNRHEELAALLRTIPADVHVLVIDNASEPPVLGHPTFPAGQVHTVHRDEEQPPNLSRLWNIGLDWADRLAHQSGGCANHTGGRDYAVAVLNDDVVLPSGLLELMANTLTATDTDIAFPCPVGRPDFLINRDRPFPGLGIRLTGWCFMVRGSFGVRADERLRWWCGDDDLQAQAVVNGRGTVGVYLSPPMSLGLTHRYPDQSTTGVLREQTEKDMEAFVKKWGQRPW